MTSKYVENAIPLININDDNTFAVNSDALRVFRAFPPDAVVSVVAVAGLYRTGKSSLMNWLLDRQAGFTVGPTINRCTRGLWIWGSPVEVTLVDGRKCFVVLLDSEGLGGIESNTEYDARIFSLAVLLCSTLVYNSLGSIDENAIGNLSFIAQLSKHIRISASDEETKDEAMQFQMFFPSFVWVVRDFTLQLVDEDGEEISPLDYLEKALEPQTGFDKSTMERNRVRQMLTAFFAQRACVTLVRPLSDEAALQQVDLVPFSELRPEFTSGIRHLKSTLFATPKPKSIHGKDLNGSMFAALCSAYVDAINAGGVPTISSAWDDVTSKECEGALSAAEESYTQSMNASSHSFPIDSDELYTLHTQAQAQAVEVYAKRAVGSGESFKRGRDELVQNLTRSYSDFHAKNAQVSETSSRELLHSLLGQRVQAVVDAIKRGAESGEESNRSYGQYVGDLRSQWTAGMEAYLSSARGPAKFEQLALYSSAELHNHLQLIVSTMDEEYEKKITALRQEILQLQQEISRSKANEEVLTMTLGERTKQLDELRQECVTLTSEVENLEQRIQGLVTQKREAERRCEELQDDVARLTTKLEAKELEYQKLEEKNTKLATENEELQKKFTTLEHEIAVKEGNARRCVVM